MKKRILALTLTLGMLFTTAASFASTEGSGATEVKLPNGEVVTIEQYEEEGMLEMPNMTMIDGMIMEVYETTTGLSFLVMDQFGPVVIHTDENTESNVGLESIMAGDLVQIYTNGIMGMSIPAQGTATAINVLAGDMTSTDASYEVTREVYKCEGANILIYYPLVEGFRGELLMDYMNQSLAKITEMYGNTETYENVMISYVVTRMDDEILSVVFTGTADIKNFKTINVQQSVNLDMTTSNEINYSNFVKDDVAVRAILDEKAKEEGLMGLEAEGIRLFFLDGEVIFYYMPLDDMATEFINLKVSMDELEGLVYTDFGVMPAS